MNGLNSSSDDVAECPLCMEPLEVDDLNFYPCTCGYQICRFCWHRIRTDENELCPACRKAYPENPADFKPLSQEQIAALKAEKRQRDQQRKQKITENRKHLANVRVVQKNLVFVVGLPPRLADPEILKRHEYFGKYGKIHKVVINPSTTYAGVQGPSASAYVTYLQNNDSLRAIQSVNNIMIDGRLIKTSLGTTKYCSHFMKNQPCPKPDCMYLHELGDSEASFTKEEMHQGKHQEYEKRLHDALIALTAQQQSSSTTPPPTAVNGNLGGGGSGDEPTCLISVNGKIGTPGELITGIGGGGGSTSTSNNSSTTNSKSSSPSTNIPNGNAPTIQQSKEAWPSLSTSPSNKENKQSNNKMGGNGGDSGGGGVTNNKKENRKSKNEKKGNKKSQQQQQHQQKDQNQSTNSNNKENNGKQETTSSEKHKRHQQKEQNQQQQQQQIILSNIKDDDENSLNELENLSNDGKTDTPSLSSTSSSSNNSGDSGTASECASGKSSPDTFPDNQTVIKSSSISSSSSASSSTSSASSATSHQQQVQQQNKANLEKSAHFGQNENTSSLFGIHDKSDGNNILETTGRFGKMNLFDDNNSFFSSNTFQLYFKNDNPIVNNNNSSHLPDLLNGTTETDEHLEREQRDAKNLLKLGGFHLNNEIPHDDWETAFNKLVMMRSNSKQMDDQQLQQQQQQHPHHHNTHEDLLFAQELQKRNLVNGLSNGMGPVPPHLQQQQQQNHNGFGGADYTNSDYLLNLSDLSRLSSQPNLMQQQQQHQRLHGNLHSMDSGHIYPGNMSKFFDFHKNQQNSQFLVCGNGHSNQQQLSDQLNMANLLENSRLSSHYFDQNQQPATNSLLGQQLHQQQKQRLLGSKFADQLGLQQQQQQQQQQQKRIPPPQQTPQQSSAPQSNHYLPMDDDLGFDPFIETQKALAELMENENVQQQTQLNHNKLLDQNCQRTRMPPPGFNHMNAFGFGVPRAQDSVLPPSLTGSKILPFMNMGANNTPPPPPPQNNWSQHSGFPPHPQSAAALEQQHSQQQNNHNKGFGSMTDWTTLDPAIVSYRQFPSFMNAPPLQQQQQQQAQQRNKDNMFMPQLNQPGQGFGGHHGLNLQSSIMNQQQQQQNSPQVNFSHTNWLNSNNLEQQNMYMNNLTNGFTNNFDKFSIPLPPGFQSNGTKQQKTECIN